MATYVPPKRAAAFVFYVALVSQANTKILQAAPTLAAADFNVSIDDGAFNPLATTPSVSPAGSKAVKISLSASEMTGDNIKVICSDAAGAEWCDLVINIQTAARQIDDLAYPATTGRSMVVDANGLVDANAVKVGPTGSGVAQAARDLGTSVLISSGAGAGQLDVTSGVVKANLAQILGSVLTETGGYLAAGFKKFFNILNPVSTMDLIAGVTSLTNAPTAGDLTAAMKLSVNAEADAALADVNLDHLVGTATGIPAIPADTYLDQIMDNGTATFDRATDSLQAVRDAAFAGGAVASVTGSVGGDVAGKVLGGGGSSMSAAGVRAVDASGNAIAPAATALDKGTWTDGKAANLDAAISTRSTYAGGAVASVTAPVTVGDYSTGKSPAELVLATPANKIATDGSGKVTAADVTVGGYASGQSPAALVLVTPANKIAADGSGQVTAASVQGNVTGSVGSVGADVGITQAGADKAWSTAVRALTDKAGFSIASGGLPQAEADKVWNTSARTLTTVIGVKKNTQLAGFMFLMRDSTDHITPKTGRSVTAERSIDGAAFGACTNSVSEVGSGVYKITLSAADLNGDVIGLKFTATGADPVNLTLKTSG